ncbi:hypothetical protein NHX12_013296, partial [Muraenolepis orangiensis]
MTRLRYLSLSLNVLSNVHNVLNALYSLEILDLSANNIAELDCFDFFNLTRLEQLNLRSNYIDKLDGENKLAVINDNIFHFLPALTYLDVTENPLTCDCFNSDFLLWALSSVHTLVRVGPGNECTYPVSKKGTMLLDMDLNLCWIDTSFLCCVSTAGLVLLTVLGAFGFHFLRWHLVYAYYRLVTSRYDARQRKGNDVYRYDAFISYNVRDEAWVHGEMLPALEAERDWRLCLHHRDFQPGRAGWLAGPLADWTSLLVKLKVPTGRSIVENVTEAIYGSRKTVCVISRHYLASEWCSREIQMASHRLLDEKKDVLILLFLEELSELQLSPYYRMRRLVRRSSYLSWPRAARHPGLFWQNVHRALESGDDSHGDHHHHGDGHHDNDAHFLSGPFSHRLLDEKKDVLILLFLEELSELQLSPYYRIRRLVRRSSYLSWPRAARHPGLFWQNFHRALESGDDSHGDHHHHGDGHHDNDAHFLSGPF